MQAAPYARPGCSRRAPKKGRRLAEMCLFLFFLLLHFPLFLSSVFSFFNCATCAWQHAAHAIVISGVNAKRRNNNKKKKKRLIPQSQSPFFFPPFLKEVHSSVSPSCSPIHTRPRTRPTPTARPRLHSSPTAATASSRHRHHSKAATHRPRTPTTHQRRLRRVAAMPSPARAPIPLHLGLFRRSHRCSRTCRRRRITYLAARATHRLLHR